MVRQLEQGPPFDAPVELRITGPDVDTLNALGDEARRILAEVPGVVHARTTLARGRPKLRVDLDRDVLSRAGLSGVDVARRLDTTLDGAVGGSVLEQTEELPVRIRVADTDRASPGDVGSLSLALASAPGGPPRWTTIDALGDVELLPEEDTIPHRNGERINTVLGYTVAGTLPEVARQAFEERLGEAGFVPPPGYVVEFGGEGAERDKSVGQMLAPAGLLAMLMLGSLVLAFDSFRLAGIIGAVGTLSLGLALGALWVFGHPFGFMAIVGAMGLLGVAINDAIVVLAALRDDAAAADGDLDAMREVVVRSTRHVLATTVTTMVGFVPLLLAGGGFWPPLAVAIGAGVAGATPLALFFVPSAYELLVARRRRAALAIVTARVA